MLIIQICVGSSCHLKGSEEIVELFRKYVAENGMDDKIVLTGSFCSGRCNREGVTITVGDKVYVGITADKFRDFWNDAVVPAVNAL